MKVSVFTWVPWGIVDNRVVLLSNDMSNKEEIHLFLRYFS